MNSSGEKAQRNVRPPLTKDEILHGIQNYDLEWRHRKPLLRGPSPLNRIALAALLLNMGDMALWFLKVREQALKWAADWIEKSADGDARVKEFAANMSMTLRAEADTKESHLNAQYGLIADTSALPSSAAQGETPRTDAVQAPNEFDHAKAKHQAKRRIPASTKRSS